MSQDILLSLSLQFTGLVQRDHAITDTIPLLRMYLKEFPQDRTISNLSVPASLFFHKQWIRISVRGHLKKVRSAVRAFERGDHEHARHELELARLWLGQAEKLFETISFFRSLATNDIERYTLSRDDLRQGDIVLSYKTSYFLRHSPLAWLVKFASNSPVTHAMIVGSEHEGSPQLIFSGDETRGLGLIDPIPVRGEIFLIMETKDKSHQNAILPTVATWQKRAMDRMHEGNATHNDPYRFPELKCQTASAIGIITILMAYLGYPLSMRNPLSQQRGIFCSELIDAIFKEHSIFLSPRSEHDAVIGPVELLYSPLLTLKGVIAHDSDLAHAQREIERQFISG